MAATFRILALMDDTQATAGFDRLAMKSEETSGIISKTGNKAGNDFASAMDKSTTKAGGFFHKFSSSLSSMGVPGAQSIDKLGSSLEQMSTKGQKGLAILSEIGKVSLIGGLAAFAAFAAEGVKGAMALQKQMEMLHTQAGASQAQVGAMTKGVLNLAPSVGTAPQVLAEGMYRVVSSMQSVIPPAKQVSTEMNVLRVAAEGAKIGNANLTDVTNALTATLFSGVKGAGNYQHAMGMLNATVGAGDMTMQDLADAMGGRLPATAKTFGVSLQDVGAALATFGDLGMRGAAAGTMLRQVIMTMGAPTSAASAALASLKISQTQLATIMRSPQGLVGALTLLKTRLQDSGATASQQALLMSRMFGGSKTAASVMMITNALDRLKTKELAVGAGGAQFAADWKATTQTLAFQFDQLKAGAQAFADKLGMYLIPKIQELGAFVARNRGVLEEMAKVISPR